MSLPPEAKPKKRSRSPATSARAGRGGAFSGAQPPAADWRVRPLPEPVDWDEALRLYAEGKSYREIAEALGQNYKRIREGFSDLGADRPRKWQCTALPHGVRLNHLWRFLRLRCVDPKHRDYDKYGRQGIRFAWESFDDFYDWSMAHGYAPGLHLDRKDPAGDFAPQNCKWVPASKITARQPRPARFKIRALGELKGTAEWARDPRCHVSRRSLEDRLERGWPPEEAITLPAGAQPSRRVTPPKRPRHSTPAHIDWKEARRLYEKEGLSEADLMERYGATRVAIAKGLQRMGVERRPSTKVPYDPERTRIKRAWTRIHRSCEDPSYSLYPANGGRGARVCRAWADFEPFLAWALASGTRQGLWLARKSLERDFSPSNCIWEPASKVSRRRSAPEKPAKPVRLITAFGETKGITAWGRDPRAQVSACQIGLRLAAGMTTEEAIATPAQNRARKDSPSTEIEAFGTKKSKTEWLRDPRCPKITMAGLNERLARGWSAEDAIATPPYAQPGQRRSSARPAKSRTQ